MGWVYFFFGFTTAIAVYSIVNSIFIYKVQKAKQDLKEKEHKEEQEFQSILEKAFGIDTKKEEAGKLIKLVKDEEDEDDPTLH